MNQSKDTLKNYFLAGNQPTQQNYWDLIDSTVTGGTTVFSPPLVLQPAADATEVFAVINAAGDVVVLNVDTTNQRVGIRTNTPANALHVGGSARIDASLGIGAAPGSDTLTVYGTALVQPATDSVTAFHVINHAGSNVVLDVDTTNVRVGINTATPGYRLEVNGSALIDGVLGLNVAPSGFYSINAAQGVNIALGQNYYVGGNQIAAANLADGTTGSGAITLNNTPTFVNRIGVGTAPAYPLHVSGNQGSTGVQVEIDDTHTSLKKLFMGAQWLTGWPGLGTNTADNLSLITNNAAQVTVTSNGLVAIGKTSAVYKLDVVGDVNVSSGQVYRVNGVQVLGARRTGWGTPTGTLYRTALTDVSTQTQFNDAIMAVITDLIAMGILGA